MSSVKAFLDVRSPRFNGIHDSERLFVFPGAVKRPALRIQGSKRCPVRWRAQYPRGHAHLQFIRIAVQIYERIAQMIQARRVMRIFLEKHFEIDDRIIDTVQRKEICSYILK